MICAASPASSARRSWRASCAGEPAQPASVLEASASAASRPVGWRSRGAMSRYDSQARASGATSGMAAKPQPDDAARAACMVARDAIAEGKLDLARKILDAQLPRRLDLPCPTCRAGAGKPCTGPPELACEACSGTGLIDARVILGTTETVTPMQCNRCGGLGHGDQLVELVVPHDARLPGR